MALKHVRQSFGTATTLQGLIVALRPVIEEHGFSINSIIQQPAAYAVTNATTDRTFDANATSVAELADVLATLLQDLKDKGILG